MKKFSFISIFFLCGIFASAQKYFQFSPKLQIGKSVIANDSLPLPKLYNIINVQPNFIKPQFDNMPIAKLGLGNIDNMPIRKPDSSIVFNMPVQKPAPVISQNYLLDKLQPVLPYNK